MPRYDLNSFVKRLIRYEWDQCWQSVKENKLMEIKVTIKEWKTSCSEARRQEVILTRMCIGHTRVTHSYLMATETATICSACNVKLMSKHILPE